MHCPRTDTLAAYETDALSSRQRAALQRHLAACAGCRQELEAQRRMVAALNALPAPALPEHLWQGVADRLAPRPVFRWQWAIGLGATAALALGILFTQLATPELPTAPVSASAYTLHHELLSARDPLADRATLGVLLAAQQDTP